MEKITIKEKINRLEAEITLLKITVTQQPNFEIDEKNWEKVKPALKKARAKQFKTLYA
jgi:hypothetical protein